MTERKAAEIHGEILHLLKVVIERDFQPFGLEEPLKTILYDLAFRAAEENWSGWKIIFDGACWAVETARSLAERNPDKDLCYYLEMGLKRGWIENYVTGMR